MSVGILPFCGELLLSRPTKVRHITLVPPTQVDKEREAENSVTALQQRVDRLSSELEEAAIQVEVLTAKGRMYDDLQTRAEQLVRI